jgi:hypothetical protein
MTEQWKQGADELGLGGRLMVRPSGEKKQELCWWEKGERSLRWWMKFWTCRVCSFHRDPGEFEI